MNQIDQLLLNKILKTKDIIYFNTNSLNKSQLQKFKDYKVKINNGYPVDYILETVEFLGNDFLIKEGVFIPRWETEWWVGEIVKAKKNQPSIFSKSQNTAIHRNDLVVEIGAGSGIIGLSLCPYFKKILACDINPKAINLIQKNQQKLKHKNYQIYNSKLFANPELQSKIRSPWILVANLPYVPLTDYDLRQENNIAYEPEEAIFSGSDGLDLYRQVLTAIKNSPPEIAFFELDPRNTQLAQKLAYKIFKIVTIYKDPDNLDRLLVCEI